MTSTSTATTPDLAEIAVRSAQRAAELERPVLATVGLDLPTNGVISLPDHEIAGIWLEPGFEVAGAGSAAEVEATGPDKYAELSGTLEELLSDAVTDGTSPFAFCGGSFDGITEGWEGFPEAIAWIPEIAVRRDSGGCTLIVSTLVQPGETGADARLAALLTSGMPAPVPGGLKAAPVGDYSSDDASFDEAVADALERIAAGELIKVVLARRLSMRSAEGVSPSALADTLAARYPDCFTYGVRRGDAAFVGASPELLVAREDDLVRATPAAGTVKGSQKPSESRKLAGGLDTPKSRLEQELVADAVYDVLEPLCTQVSAHLPMVVPAGPVQHLSTLIEGILREPVPVLDLVAALHPTPAVGGVPLGAAKRVIELHENFSRGWYAGPVGIVRPDGTGSFAVALRGALLRGNDIDLFAGAGIVEGSVPHEERREIELKLGAVAAALVPER